MSIGTIQNSRLVAVKFATFVLMYSCIREIGIESVLQNVLGIARVRYATADEIAQPGSLLRKDCGDLTVLLGHCPGGVRRLIHPLL